MASEDDSMSREIVIALIVFLVVLFALVTMHRAYHRHKARAILRQAIQAERHPPPSRIRIPFYLRPRSGVSPQIPEQWAQGRHIIVEVSTGPASTTTRRYVEYEGGTPSVWGIDLERGRGRRTPMAFPSVALRGGAVARPAGGVHGYSGRRLFDDGSSEALDLPRYEEPPPVYEKVLEEEARLSVVQETSANTPANAGPNNGQEINIIPSNETTFTAGGYPTPTTPPPAVLRNPAP